MELNELSNPFASNKRRLDRLSGLHRRLLHRATTNPQRPCPAPPKASPVLETVTYQGRAARETGISAIDGS